MSTPFNVMRSVFLDYSTVSVGDLDPQALQAAAPNLILREATRQADVADAIAGCEIVLLNKLRMTREIIAGSNSLKLIALAATGTNNIDLEAARDHGVAVCNIRDYCTPSVTQHVLGVLLALTHRLADYSRDATDGTWASSPHFTILRHPIRELGGLPAVLEQAAGEGLELQAVAALGVEPAEVLIGEPRAQRRVARLRPAATARGPAGDGHHDDDQTEQEAEAAAAHRPNMASHSASEPGLNT